MMRTAIRRLGAATAAALIITGCGGSAGGAKVGKVTNVHHPNVSVAGVQAGNGAAIRAAQHVKTDRNGRVQYTIGSVLTCEQNTQTDVTAEPTHAVLLRYNSGNTVTCGTWASKGNRTERLTVSHLTITIAEPVFTIVRRRNETIIRVAEGSVTVKSSDGGPAVTVSAGQQLTVADGQVPGKPAPFDFGQLSSFELSALKHLMKVTAPPVVTSIDPASGLATGHTKVVITGTGFAVLGHVYFGSTPAAFTVNSGTQITATSPPGKGTVHITVATPAGTSSATTTDQFTYTAPPVITGAQPADIGPADVTPGQPAATKIITVSNPSDTQITITAADASAPFAVTTDNDTCTNQTIQPQGSCTITVEFAPTELGTVTGTLTITSSAGTASAQLTGTGFATLTVTVNGPGEVDVSSQTACSGSCEYRITSSTTLTEATSGAFEGWRGTCIGRKPSCGPITADAAVTANFKG